MNKIKQLEAWLLSKDWLYDKMDALAKAISKALSRHQYNYHLRYIEKTVDEMDTGKCDKTSLKLLAKNALNATSTEFNSARSKVSTKFLIDLTLRSAIVIWHEVGALVGFQPMKGPVGQVYSMQYKEVDESNSVAPKKTNEGTIKFDEPGRRMTLEILA